MKNYLIIIFFLFFNFELYSQNISSIQLFEPLEITIYKNFIQNSYLQIQNVNYPDKMLSFNMEFHPFQFQRSFYILDNKYSYFQLNSLNSYSLLNYYYNKSKINKDFIEFELIPFLNQKNIPWNQQTNQFHLRTALIYGKNLNQNNTISAIIGIINEQQLDQHQTTNNQNIVQYGKVFFTPGIQLRSNSVVLKTFLEMPLYRYNFDVDTQKIITPTKDNINANIQIQINR